MVLNILRTSVLQAYSEINQDSLIVVVDHDVVRLYVSVNHLNDLVAIVNGSQNIVKVHSKELVRKSDGLDLFDVSLPPTLLIEMIVWLVPFFDYFSETALAVVLSHEVKLVFVRVIDDFVKVNNVGVLKLLKNFELFFDAVVRASSLSRLLLLQHRLVHLLKCVHISSVGIST